MAFLVLVIPHPQDHLMNHFQMVGSYWWYFSSIYLNAFASPDLRSIFDDAIAYSFRPISKDNVARAAWAIVRTIHKQTTIPAALTLENRWFQTILWLLHPLTPSAISQPHCTHSENRHRSWLGHSTTRVENPQGHSISPRIQGVQIIAVVRAEARK